MKILFYSDLHTEIAPYSLPGEAVADADIVILAGDIGSGKKVATWINENIPTDKIVIWIWGNHEYYGNHLPATQIKAAREDAIKSLHMR